jgi:hypothetical protein
VKTFQLGATRDEENEKVYEWWLGDGEKGQRGRVEGNDVCKKCLRDA